MKTTDSLRPLRTVAHVCDLGLAVGLQIKHPRLVHHEQRLENWMNTNKH